MDRPQYHECSVREIKRLLPDAGSFQSNRQSTTSPSLVSLASNANSAQYAYMSHFFANPLAVLLADNRGKTNSHQPQLYEAIRNTSSFRR